MRNVTTPFTPLLSPVWGPQTPAYRYLRLCDAGAMPSVGGRAEAAAMAEAASVSGRPKLDDLTSRSSAVQVGGDVRGTAIAVIWK